MRSVTTKHNRQTALLASQGSGNLTFLTATAGTTILAAFVVSICLQHG
jgi:hypothetical protein